MNREASADVVIKLLSSIDRFWFVLDGGWGVDALLSKQTRPHSDLDLIVLTSELLELKRHLESIGFTRAVDSDGIVYSSDELDVDLHPVHQDSDGFYYFDIGDGKSWPIPPQAMNASGKIHAKRYNCLSVDMQVQCHTQGYDLQRKDVQDLLSLQKEFGCVLPLRLYRDGQLQSGFSASLPTE